MANVRFYELSSSKELRATEKKINKELRSKGYDASVRLFQDQNGKIGFSISKIPADGGKKLLELIYRTVCEAVGYKRGRPPAKESTRQVKCRLPETVYRRLESEAKKRKMSPSRLLSELAADHIA